LDLHGAVPEESRMQGDYLNAQKLTSLERFLLLKSHTCILVTKEMQDYYLKKYPNFTVSYIIVPVVKPEKLLHITQTKKAFDFGYVGGIQPWQNLKVLIEAIEKTTKESSWIFIVPDTNAFLRQYGRFGSNVTIVTAEGDKLNSYLSQVRYGLLPRAESIVNLVSFPTKLIDYMENGCVPVLNIGKVGAIEDHRINYIELAELLSGKILSSGEMDLIVSENLKILSEIREIALKNFKNLLRKNL
jgi:glycosyltransferase involved in cell wall biosynthesis